MRRHPRRTDGTVHFERRRAVVALALVLVTGCGGSSDRPAAGDSADTAVLDEWIALESEARGVDRREALRRADAFTTGVGLDRLYALCGDPPEGAPYQAALRTLLRAKLELDPMPGAGLAAWIGDPSIATLCRSTAVRSAQRMRGDLTPDELGMIADTLLALADTGVDDGDEAALDWERLAVQFGHSDRVVARVSELLTSTDDAARARGALIAAESTDPRVADAIVVALREVALEPETYPRSRGPIAETAGRLVGARALMPLEKLLIDGGWAGRAAAVPGLGFVEHPRAVELLVMAGADLPDVSAPDAAASGMQPTEPERRAIYDATRRLERYLDALLAAPDAGAATNAYRLIDRASRVGPLVRPADAVAALERFRSRGDVSVPGTEIDATIARLGG